MPYEDVEYSSGTFLWKCTQRNLLCWSVLVFLEAKFITIKGLYIYANRANRSF